MEERYIKFGEMTGATVGLVMREAVRRAIVAINSVRFNFEIAVKEKKEDGKDDYFTSADLAAQDAIIKLLRKNFPDFGVVAEEKNLSTKSFHPTHDFWFTVDPLDGTKAFMRRQSHGIGVMISLICDDRIIAAYVGDVNTGEIYGYRPDSEKVWRITKADTPILLEARHQPLSESCVLLTDRIDDYTLCVQKSAQSESRGGLFRGIEISKGSIGMIMARLWKGEVGCVVLRPGKEASWDICPIFGISEKLGFVFLNLDPVNKEIIIPKRFVPTRQFFPFDLETFIVHKSSQEELIQYFKNNKRIFA